MLLYKNICLHIYKFFNLIIINFDNYFMFLNDMQISAKAKERERERGGRGGRKEGREREREKELIFNILYCDLNDPGACTMHCGRCA